jgi:predicted nucleic acid-binding protein
MLDLIVGNEEGRAVRQALATRLVHVVDHASLEVAGALRVLAGGGSLPERELRLRIRLLSSAPFTNHPALELLPGALDRAGLRLGDALSVELSDRLGVPLMTTDGRLASIWPQSWLVTPPGQGPLSR